MGFSEAAKGLARIRGESHALFRSYDIDHHISLLDAIPEPDPYHQLSPSVHALWTDIRDNNGDEAFDLFQRATLLRLIDCFTERAAGKRYSPSILACFTQSFDRILSAACDPTFENYRMKNDILLKDLALCRQKIFPAGARVIEPDSGFHRALMLRGGPLQAVRMASLLARSGGNRHWYQTHTHLSELQDFNPAGWERCFLRLAEMLRLNPEVRGTWGGSWFYDPALETISPHLAYLRQRPVANGASLFFSNVDLHGGALSKSRTRIKAHQRGEYLPRAYVLIWPRRALLRWAEKVENR